MTNRSVPLFALGIVLALTGVAIIALTFRKAKPAPVAPNKSQLRELAESQADLKKLRLAGGIITGLGVVLLAIS